MNCFMCQKADSGFDFTPTVQPIASAHFLCDSCIQFIVSHTNLTVMKNFYEAEKRAKSQRLRGSI